MAATNRIYLHGRLKKKFGGPFDWGVTTAAESVRALCVMIDGFEQELRKGQYKVVRGSHHNGMQLDPSTLHLNLNGSVHIVPVAAGAKRGVGKIILGSLLVASAFLVPGPQVIGAAQAAGAAAVPGGLSAAGVATAGGLNIFGFSISASSLFITGMSMVLGGIGMMISPQPKRERAKSNASYLFSGITNGEDQGAAVPLIYGRMLVGSHVIGSAYETSDIALNSQESESK